MNLHGVDIYIWSPEMPDVPKEFGNFKLTMITDRGTRVWPPPAPDIAPSDWPRCRYESDSEASDSDVDALVNKISDLGYVWTKCQKLYRKDGNNLYSAAY